MSDIEERVLRWALTRKTGASSKCMAAYLTGNECDGSYPHDAGDFGRCVDLLQAVPELRKLFPKMAQVNRYWAALVPEWNKIEAIAGDYSRQFRAIQNILRPIEDKDAGVIRIGEGITIRCGDKKMTDNGLIDDLKPCPLCHSKEVQ